MKQGDNGDALICETYTVDFFHTLSVEILLKAVIYIDAVFDQSAFVRTVVAGAAGCSEKVAGIGLQVIQQFVSTGTRYVLLINFNEFEKYPILTKRPMITKSVVVGSSSQQSMGMYDIIFWRIEGNNGDN